VRLLVVTEEQRYGPRWLRDNDDDDERYFSNNRYLLSILSTVRHYGWLS